ncbi:adenylyltransferase/cytidyltransferase family protein [Pigmentibacter sp. JX0631]|uniref:adenylyltransferase/cytidyltransferase family protein n=1 Tax=Pigmentibacter sp. JX0631 TaxID=2976982 RepID=UPI0024686DA4|nr:adenylyltransferase/cytidyltransferase family protein [Pigmentibacter sp. JX0631]WGL60243.1 adenylyltransferase/cytidyltransferase family protein [Pigmentibacter sp. JX0631]
MEKKVYEFSVYIGRFQPFHLGHLQSIKFALKYSKKLIIILGGAYSSPSPRGPWNITQRIEMIRSCLTTLEKKKVFFVGIRDRLYCEEKWIQNVQGEVFKITNSESNIAIIGHQKDSSSYYLKIFPQWKFLETGNFKQINATDIRKIYFLKKDLPRIKELVPKSILNYLTKYSKSDDYNFLKNKFKYIEKNKDSFFNENVTNVLIFCNQYILLLKSKETLKEGLYSLPEANNFNKDFESNALEYLQYEVRINIDKEYFSKSYVSSEFFNYSDRFPLGKQISKTYLFILKSDNLPVISKARNSSEVIWILLDDLSFLENKMYSDHYQIIQKFKKNFY